MEITIQNNIKTKYILKAILFCIVFTGFLFLFSFAKNFLPGNYERLAHGIIGILAALLTTALFLKFDRKQFSAIGLTFENKTLVKFFAGFIVGIIIMGLLVTGVLYSSNVSVKLNSEGRALYFFLVTLPLIPLAFMEELGFRAYPLRLLQDTIGIRLCIIITSILFALYHIANGWTIASSFYGPAVWGLLFGLAAVYSKGIAMPTGIHYAANLTTTAFGEPNNTTSIWIVRQSHITATESGGAYWKTIIPALILLVFAVLCLELYVRRKTAANINRI